MGRISTSITLVSAQSDTSIPMEKYPSCPTSAWFPSLQAGFTQCACSHCCKQILSKINPVHPKKKQAKVLYKLLECYHLIYKNKTPQEQEMESMYSFGEDSALISSLNSYCLLSDRRCVAYIDYMLCSVEIMRGLFGLKSLLLRVKQ